MEFQSQISLDLLSNSTKILENLCGENNENKKALFASNMLARYKY